MLLQIDFSHEGPFGEGMAAMLRPLAEDIAGAKGLCWKIWTENEAEKIAGGIYMFESEADAQDYLSLHTKRLAGFGITDVRARFFDVNETLSQVTRWTPPASKG